MAHEPSFHVLFLDELFGHAPARTPIFRDIGTSPPPKPVHKPSMPPLKVSMLLHFNGAAEAFAPEKTRTSPAYTQFIRELLRDGLVERPTKAQRAKYPGWAYKTTPKGNILVKAICAVPMPVERTRWIIPT